MSIRNCFTEREREREREKRERERERERGGRVGEVYEIEINNHKMTYFPKKAVWGTLFHTHT